MKNKYLPDVSIGGRDSRGPWSEKFEQVFSDDQVSLVEGEVCWSSMAGRAGSVGEVTEVPFLEGDPGIYPYSEVDALCLMVTWTPEWTNWLTDLQTRVKTYFSPIRWPKVNWWLQNNKKTVVSEQCAHPPPPPPPRSSNATIYLFQSI